MSEPIADDKFGKTRPDDDTNSAVDPDTQYTLKKQNADLKKVTSSENQFT